MTTENNSSSKLNPTQRALLAVKAMHKRLENFIYKKNEPLAIVGMSCRLPGGVESPEDFWQLLINSGDAITDIPTNRWDLEKYYEQDPAVPGKMYVHQGGFINDVYHFDRNLFGLSKRESQSMDPQQRLLLELSWEALESSGVAPRKAQSCKTTGLFVGISTNDYARFHIHSGNLNDIDIYSFTGCAPSITSGRISQLLDLGGPAISIDTACSSSLVALHLARQSVLADECELALVGGVNLMLSPENTVYFCKTSALSPTCRCRTFDESADGYVRSEGGGVIVLKRLSKALDDNDNILAVLQGSAINHDGEGIGLTAPNGDSQQRLVEKALQSADVSPNDISYIETHGTGTPLGDPIEVQALGRVFGKRSNAVAIGSSKSNIGHTEAAAGIAGILKTVLCLQHQTLAPNLHFEKPSSYIPWDSLPLRVVQEVETWQPVNGKRIAGVSAFGFSGTNAHAVFTEAPRLSAEDSDREGDEYILALSGKSSERLQRLVKSVLDFTQQHSELSLSNFSFSMNRGKCQFNHRNILRFRSHKELTQQLNALLATPAETTIEADSDLPALCLDVSCTNSLIDILHENLIEREPYYASIYRICMNSFEDALNIKQYMPDFLEEYRHLPKTFSRYYSWIKMLQDFYGEFDYINAQGIGLLAAESASGNISYEDAIQICSAFITGKHHTHISDATLVTKTTCLLNGEAPTHNHDFESWYRCLIAEHIEPVSTSIDYSITIDCSGKQKGEQVISLDNRHASDPYLINTLCEALYLRGYDVQWQLLYHDQNVRMIATPGSPFLREELCLTHMEHRRENNNTIKPLTTHAEHNVHPLLGQALVMPNSSKRQFQQYLAPRQVLFLYDHGFLNQVVVPATAYIEIITAALRKISDDTSIHLEDISYHAGLYLPDDQGIYIQVEVDGNHIALYSASENAALDNAANAWTLHCTAIRSTESTLTVADKTVPGQVAELEKLPFNEQLYIDLNNYGYLFGPAHQGISRLMHKDTQTTTALVQAHSSIEQEFYRYGFHPAHLDACCHAILELLDRDSQDSIFITLGKDRVHFYQKAEKKVFVKAVLTERTDDTVKANLSIYALDGACIAQIEGYTMKRVNRAQLLPASLDTASAPTPTVTTNENWLYSNHWQVNHPTTISALPAGRWLVTGYTSSTNASMAVSLQQWLEQETVHVKIIPLSELTGELKLAHNNNESLYILHLCTDIARLSGEVADQDIRKLAHDGYMSLSEVAKAIAASGTTPSVFTLTKGAMAVDGSESHLNFPSATLWGAGRSFILEHPRCRFANIDLDPSLPLDDFTSLKAIFSGQYPDEDQFAIRNSKLFINRLTGLYAAQKCAGDVLTISDKDCFKLAINEPGAIDNLHYVARLDEALGENDVEIQLYAAALNFYDVVTALDLIDTSLVNGKENDECRFGLDAVGQITGTGSSVSLYKPGDWVMGFAPGCIASRVRVHQDCVTPKPRNIGRFECATIPTAFLTAHYALQILAKMRPGDKVLIHAAAGGVGIAAINLANVVGAEVYATASKAKWPLLRQLGVKHIYNSRTLDFADQIIKDTKGEGIDIVLNSFIGEYIHKNVSILKEGGRFVEIGEREILTEQQVSAYDKPFEYYPFTLFEISRDHHTEIRTMFETLQSVWDSPAFTGIPYQVYSAENIKEAFRLMQQGHHKGKLVIAMNPAINQSRNDLQHTKAALITGGLGGIGWAVTQWLANSETEILYITGRSALNDSIVARIRSLSERGKTVKYISADIANAGDVKRVFTEITNDGVTLTAILHAAGIMSNALMVDEDPASANEVLMAKTTGTWLLHKASQRMNLEHFICFSSTTALLGASGAASYAAGNAFVDSLMQYRSNLGLAAQAINWGAWKEVGMLTRLNNAAQEYWQENGMQALPTSVALATLNRISQHDEPRIAVLPTDWAKWIQQYSKLPSLLLSMQGMPQNNAAVNDTSQKHCDAKVELDFYQLVSDSVRKVLRLDFKSPINEEQSFREMGIDSLMSVELRNILSKVIGEKLSSTLLFNYTSIKTLTEYLSSQYADKLPVQSKKDGATTRIQTLTQSRPTHKIDVLSLLKEQLRHLLRLAHDAPLNENEPFKNMGIDSLMSVELRNTLSQKLGIKLSSTVLFNYTTIELLASHLHEQVIRNAEPGNTPSGHPVITVTPASQPSNPELQEDPDLADLRALLDAKLMENGSVI